MPGCAARKVRRTTAAIGCPCFLHWPAGGFDKPVTVDRLAAHLDLLPTLVDLCALQLPKPVKFDGVSLKPLLADPRARLARADARDGHAAQPDRARIRHRPNTGENCAVMTDRWRLVNDRELYDMTADPGQQQDMAGSSPRWSASCAPPTEVLGRCERNDRAGAAGRSWEPPTRRGGLCARRLVHDQGQLSVEPSCRGRWRRRCWPLAGAICRSRRLPDRGPPLAARVRAADGRRSRADKRVDAWLGGRPVRGTALRRRAAALPVARVRLKIGDEVQEADVQGNDSEGLRSRVAVGASGRRGHVVGPSRRRAVQCVLCDNAETEMSP